MWSAVDILWELSPGLRAAVGEQRPPPAEDVAGLFYELGPAKCKVCEMCMHAEEALDVDTFRTSCASPLTRRDAFGGQGLPSRRMADNFHGQSRPAQSLALVVLP